MRSIRINRELCQVSIRQILAATAWVGVAVAILSHPSGNGWVLFVPFVSASALFFAFYSSREGLRTLLASWGLFGVVASLVLLELASGYGWKLPLCGVTPGPPTEELQLGRKRPG